MVFKQPEKNKQQFALANAFLALQFQVPQSAAAAWSSCCTDEKQGCLPGLEPFFGLHRVSEGFWNNSQVTQPPSSPMQLQLQLNQQMGNSCQFLSSKNSMLQKMKCTWTISIILNNLCNQNLLENLLKIFGKIFGNWCMKIWIAWKMQTQKFAKKLMKQLLVKLPCKLNL